MEPSIQTPDVPEDAICRVCHAGQDLGPLFHPCKCSGSIRYVHEDCLIGWLDHSGGEMSCEICGTPFSLIINHEATPTQVAERVWKALYSIPRVVLRPALAGFLWFILLPWNVSVSFLYNFFLVEGEMFYLDSFFLNWSIGLVIGPSLMAIAAIYSYLFGRAAEYRTQQEQQPQQNIPPADAQPGFEPPNIADPPMNMDIPDAAPEENEFNFMFTGPWKKGLQLYLIISILPFLLASILCSLPYALGSLALRIIPSEYDYPRSIGLVMLWFIAHTGAWLLSKWFIRIPWLKGAGKAQQDFVSANKVIAVFIMQVILQPLFIGTIILTLARVEFRSGLGIFYPTPEDYSVTTLVYGARFVYGHMYIMQFVPGVLALKRWCNPWVLPNVNVPSMGDPVMDLLKMPMPKRLRSFTRTLLYHSIIITLSMQTAKLVTRISMSLSTPYVCEWSYILDTFAMYYGTSKLVRAMPFIARRWINTVTKYVGMYEYLMPCDDETEREQPHVTLLYVRLILLALLATVTLGVMYGIVVVVGVIIGRPIITLVNALSGIVMGMTPLTSDLDAFVIGMLVIGRCVTEGQRMMTNPPDISELIMKVKTMGGHCVDIVRSAIELGLLSIAVHAAWLSTSGSPYTSRSIDIIDEIRQALWLKVGPMVIPMPLLMALIHKNGNDVLRFGISMSLCATVPYVLGHYLSWTGWSINEIAAMREIIGRVLFWIAIMSPSFTVLIEGWSSVSRQICS